MATSTATFRERDLLNQATVTVRVDRSRGHRHLMRFGLWVTSLGLRIMGFGRVDVEDQT